MAMDFILSQQAQYPDLSSDYEELGSLCQQRLWHELSLKIKSFISNPQNNRGQNFKQLYENFVIPVETRFNSVRLALMLCIVAESLGSPQEALQFLTSRLQSITQLSAEAKFCLEMDIILMTIHMGNLQEAKTALKTAKDTLNQLSSSERHTFSKYYKALSGYYKAVGPSEEFYRAALTFLSYTPMEDMTSKERYQLAVDMALAAITGRDIYNFGEVIATPILATLRGTENHWLESLVVALNRGEVGLFHEIVNANHVNYHGNAVLHGNHEEILGKVIRLSLMNLAFERPSHERILTFTEIAERCQIELCEVESIVMKAMSLKLIKGNIEEVKQEVHISWIRPRVLPDTHLRMLEEQLSQWTQRVKTVLSAVEDHTAELMV